MVNTVNKEYRPDIAARIKVEQVLDLERVSYDDYMDILFDFLQEIMRLNEEKLSQHVRKKLHIYLHAVREYIGGEKLGCELKPLRIDAWKEYNKQKGVDKAMIRVFVIALYDKESFQNEESCFDILALIFSLLRSVDEKLCAIFGQFLINSPTMEKYKLLTCD